MTEHAPTSPREARPAEPGLRAARRAHGWSQSEAATRLAELARARGTPVAGAASLKTQLSRWENGHALPEPQYRDLLGELYARTPAELGLTPGPGGGADGPAADGPSRLRGALAEAEAAARAGPDLWWDQLAAARRLDDELGAAGAAPLVDAQVDRLAVLARHTLDRTGRVELAAVLAAAAALGGAQALDGGRHDVAWHRYDQSLAAARVAGLPAAVATALAGQAEVLVDVGAADAALRLLGQAEAGCEAGSGTGSDGAGGVRLAAATALAAAAAGDHDTSAQALTTARRQWQAPRTDAVHPRDGPPVELVDLHRWHGRALVDLGDAGAADPLGRALAARHRSIRARADVHADLALALRATQPDAAAEHAATARRLARSIGSERVAARLAPARANP